MRAVCIARHRILSEHYRDRFAAIGLQVSPAVGFEEGMRLARRDFVDVVLCDYDLLVAAPLEMWERDPVLSEIPIVAVSLTRRPEEAHVVDVNGIAGFLYLPTLSDTDAACMLRAFTGTGVRPPAEALRWPSARRELDAPRREYGGGF
jgi:hypothetical protein